MRIRQVLAKKVFLPVDIEQEFDLGVEQNDATAFRLLQDADWNNIGRRLTARVIWITGTATLSNGVTARDIAQTVILKTLSGDRKWDPNKGELLPWLFDQVKSELSNLLTSSATKQESLVESGAEDDEDASELQDVIDFRAVDEGLFPDSKPQTPEAILIRNQILEREVDIVLQAVDDIEVLTELFDTITTLYSTKAEDLAEQINVPVEDIYNRLKRLRNRISHVQQNVEE